MTEDTETLREVRPDRTSDVGSPSERRRSFGRGVALAAWARLAPHRLAIQSSHGNRSFLELEVNSSRLARALFERGIGLGDGLALLCGNRPEFVEVMVAAERAGIRVTPIMPDLTPREAEYVLGDCRAAAIIIDPSLDEKLVDVAQRVGGAKAKLALGADLAGCEHYETVLAQTAGTPFDTGFITVPMFYTSGTTGQLKGVYRRESVSPEFLAMTAIGGRMKLTAGRDLALVPLPLSRAGVFTMGVRLPLISGVGVVLVNEREPERILSLIAQHRITYAYLAPFLFHRLLQLPDETRRRWDVSSLRNVLHTGAPCPVAVKRRIIEWLGPILHEYYGGTEGGNVAISSEEWLKKPGSVGKANGRVMILDDNRAPVPHGIAGHIYMQAPPRGRFEYFNAPEKTRAAYHGDFYTMGDQGYLDADGFLFLTGRSAEIINSGGLKAYPAEIDAVLLEHPAVEDAACIGIPNEEMSEEVRALIKLKPGYAAADDLTAQLDAHCRRLLAGYKCPRSFGFVAEVPRLATGKILRQRLRQPYWQGTGREI
jgi:long-chain acyl-CoA synthetase